MSKVNVKVPHRSGFDKSHKAFLTGKVGTLVPILTDELIPNTKVHLRSVISAQLPPLATDTFMRVNLKVEAFFVPTRLLYGGFEPWLTHEPLYVPGSPDPVYAQIPILRVPGSTSQPQFVAGSLGDYLGARCKGTSSTLTTPQYYNIFPFLAYHKIYDDWYRNVNIQSPVFVRPFKNSSGGSSIQLYTLPYVTLPESLLPENVNYFTTSKLADGVNLGDLRQRNFGYDYFTEAFASPQKGGAQKVEVNTSNNTFTIAALRAANSLQQFAERNQIAGYRLQDFVKANYGANLSDGVAQRSIYLGSGQIEVYNKGIYQSAPLSAGDATNPFGTSGVAGLGAKFGDAACNGQISLVDEFTAQEPGYLMVMASLVPVVTYGAGIDKMMTRYNNWQSQTDLATALLQNVGNEPIKSQELTGIPSDHIFGYTERYASWKTRFDRLHGLVRDGQTLQAFALQRTIEGEPEISAEFLQIPTSYMDQVTNVAGWLSQYGYWADCFFDYKVSMPLAQYSVPSLQDPAYEHGVDVQVDLNGSRL